MIKTKWEKRGNLLVSKIKHVPTELNPKLEFYEQDSCICVEFGNRPKGEYVAYTEEVYPGIALEFNEQGFPCGIEVFAILKKEDIDQVK